MSKKIFYSLCTLCIGLLFGLNGWTEGGAWRSPTSQEKTYYESTFKSNGYSVLKKKPTPGAPSTSVQWIIVEVEADAARARSTLEHFNWYLLKRLIR